MTPFAALVALIAAPVPLTVEAAPFPGLSEPRTVGCMVLRAGLTLTSEDDAFGGYSDLTLDGPDGRALFVSDAASVLLLRLHTDDAGDVVGVGEAVRRPLIERDGSVLGKRDGDAEGLAHIDGGYVVSLEGEDRIARMTADGALGATTYPDPGDEAVLGGNSGFEALAAIGDGRLIALSEGTDSEGYALVRRGTLNDPLSAWARARYRPAREFGVTGAAADPATGDLYVLERAYSPWRGVRIRIVRVRADDLGDELLRGRTLTRMGFLEGIDNMEGIAAARMMDGALRLYLVSDDNFSAAQRTVLLTLGLAPGCEDGDPAEPAARRDPPPQEPVEP